MATYLFEFKAAITEKLLSPRRVGIREVAKKTGISEASLHMWITRAKEGSIKETLGLANKFGW